MALKIFVGIPTRGRNHLLHSQYQILRSRPDLQIHYLFNDEEPTEVPLGVEYTITHPEVPWQGAETKSYNEEHLANLWNALLSLARLNNATHFMVLGSDVMPNPRALDLIINQVKLDPDACIGALVLVNEIGVSNFWHLGGGRGWHKVKGSFPFEVERFSGGLVVFPVTEDLKFIPNTIGGEISETSKQFRCILVPQATCKNIRPNGVEWNV